MLEKQLEIIATNLERIANVLESFARPVHPELVKDCPDVRPEPTATAVDTPVKQKKTKKEEKPAAEVNSSPLTEVDVRNAMKDLLNKKGWDPAEKLLSKFAKSCKVKDVKPQDYAALIKEVKIEMGKT